ncbi:MAG: hypothetical protein CL517_06305 [Actinobacteria bacterium]|nr:hypothetical protein [Actinomycetota bacterium]MEC7809759.1 DNA recombination protein RmuC [Actinomycetota bacterium]|tara:strand:+ start:4964 stop:6172 length:1209 start_codon:yes stop_codon:yes gene_type:complete
MDSSVIIVVLLIALTTSVLVSVKTLRNQKVSSHMKSDESEDEVSSMLERLTSDLKVQMGELATKALQDNNEQFLTLASERMNVVKEQTKGLLDPFVKQIDQLGKTVSELRSAHDKEKGVVETLTSRMGELSASNVALTEALRSPTARGAWGENQLRNVIELAGMTPYCDYEEQSTGENRSGNIIRPDVIVRLPNGAYLAVDAKVPLDAYLEAQESSDQVEIENHLSRHATALRAHVNALASRKYWELNDGPAPEFVVLFVPGESFLADALRVDVSLLQDAMEKRVLLASPVNLLALLWAVARGWQEARITEHAKEIADLGEELYERIGTVLGHIDKTGRGLTSAVNAYNTMVGSVDGRLMVTLRKFPNLGIGNDEISSPEELEAKPRDLQVDEMQGLSSPEI